MRKRATVPATLLRIPSNSVRYLDAESKGIQCKHGARLGRLGIARGVINGLCAAQFSFASCRSEFEIQDMIRDLLAAATAPNTGNQEVR